MVSLPKSDLRAMSEDLTMPFSEDISKDELIKSVSNAMINNEEQTFDEMIVLIEIGEEDKGSI